MDRTDFLNDRRKGLGGSDMAAIFNQSKWSTPRDIWLDKTNRVPINDQPNRFLDGNTHQEPFIAAQYEMDSGNKTKEVETIIHPRHQYLRANIDREIIGNDPGVLEIKNVVPKTFSDIKHNGMKIEYIFQIQFYFLCTGYSWGEFAIMNKLTYDLLIIPAEPDKEIMQAIEEKAIEFWNDYVLKDIEPPSDSTTNDIQIDRVGGEMVDMNNNIALDNLLDEYSEIREMEEGIKELKKTNAQAIIDSISGNEAVKINDYHIYNRENKPRKTLDAKAIRKEYPEIYNKYAIESKSKKSLRIFKHG